MIQVGATFLLILLWTTPKGQIESQIKVVRFNQDDVSWNWNSAGSTLRFQRDSTVITLHQKGKGYLTDSGSFDFKSGNLTSHGSYRMENVFGDRSSLLPEAVQSQFSSIHHSFFRRPLIPIGQITLKDKNDTIAYYEYENGQKHGLCFDRAKKTGFEKTEYYYQGRLNGTSVYQDSFRTEVTYDMGQAILRRTYYPDGQLHKEEVPRHSVTCWRADSTLLYQLTNNKEKFIYSGYYNNGRLKARGYFSSFGTYDSIGLWTFYNRRGGYVSSKKYIPKPQLFELDYEPEEPYELFQFFMVVEEPRYRGGEKALNEYLQQRVSLTSEDEGTVWFRLKIARSGQIDSVWVNRESGYLQNVTVERLKKTLAGMDRMFTHLQIQGRSVECVLEVVVKVRL